MRAVQREINRSFRAVRSAISPYIS
jgi:hypothetical protein